MAGEPDPVDIDPIDPPSDPPSDPPADPPSDPPSYWSDNWREGVVSNLGADLEEEEKAKLSKQLERFGSPSDIYRAFRDTKGKLDGKLENLVPKLPENPSEEDIKAYREAMNVPMDPGKYADYVDEGVIIGEQDKPMVEDFQKAALDMNLTGDQFKGVMNWWHGLNEKVQSELADQNEKWTNETIDALRDEYGGAYKQQFQLAKGFLQGAPESVREMIENGYHADGRPLMSHPDTVRWFASVMKEVNPAITLVDPNSTMGSMESIQTRKAAIEKTMHTKDYTPQLQKEYLELLEAEERLSKKA